MRTLKLQVQLTLDGFMAGPDGEMDWMTFPWTEDVNRYVSELNQPVDTILLGRRLAQGFIPHWLAHPDAPGAQKINNARKVVFTRTLEQLPWPHTQLAKGNLLTEVNALKNEPGGDLMVYGGGTLVADLIAANLVDEYHLFINPVAIGNGMPAFPKQNANRPLTLARVTAFDCGIVALHYKLPQPT